MNTRFVALVISVTLGLGASLAAGEWVTMFDGKSLTGWTQKNGWASYRVEDGTIVGRTADGSPNSFLCSIKSYGDFELEFEVQVDDRLNSGVQIRSQTADSEENSVYNPGRVNGPQVEIEAGGNSGGEAGYVYGEATGRGWLTPEQRLKPHTHFQSGQWNKYRVIAKGPRIQTFINGQPIEDLTDDAIYETHPEGFIGLQVHGIGRNEGPYEVRWRKLRIREID